jgi:hypothetical protein
MFEELGSRLTGSLAVSFIQSVRYKAGNQTPKPAPLRGRAAVFAGGNSYLVPGEKNQFVELRLSPTLPAGAGKD